MLRFFKLTRNKTLVESLKLGKTLDLDIKSEFELKLKMSDPVLGRVKVVTNFIDHLIFVRKAYIPNFRPLVPFHHGKKFVVGGGC